jgi:hypothetical protein
MLYCDGRVEVVAYDVDPAVHQRAGDRRGGSRRCKAEAEGHLLLTDRAVVRAYETVGEEGSITSSRRLAAPSSWMRQSLNGVSPVVVVEELLLSAGGLGLRPGPPPSPHCRRHSLRPQVADRSEAA